MGESGMGDCTACLWSRCLCHAAVQQTLQHCQSGRAVLEPAEEGMGDMQTCRNAAMPQGAVLSIFCVSECRCVKWGTEGTGPGPLLFTCHGHWLHRVQGVHRGGALYP